MSDLSKMSVEALRSSQRFFKKPNMAFDELARRLAASQERERVARGG